MNADNRLKILKEWEKQAVLFNQKSSDIKRLFSLTDSPLFEYLFNLFSLYTNSVSDSIGDNRQWLFYYYLETSLGRKPKEVSFGEKEIMVDSIERLMEVIEMDNCEEKG